MPEKMTGCQFALSILFENQFIINCKFVVMNPFKGILTTALIIFSIIPGYGQDGTISGTVINPVKKAVKGASVICSLSGSTTIQYDTTNKQGFFSFSDLAAGYYRISISLPGYARRVIDSIYIRKDRNSFNLEDIELSNQLVQEETVTVYAEKPLVEMTKDGKIIYNTSESAIAQTSTATDLLKTTPLVSVNPNGNVLLRGKEVKVLIDEKPVELNTRQLQELLESMPGSNIEKIEVMTTPPPQFATERGGVINIVTKKGKAGVTLRASTYYGTRGEWGGNLTAGYKKNKTSFQLVSGFGHSLFTGEQNSYRQNFFRDSANRFHSGSDYENGGNRPFFRLQANYDPDKRNQFSATIQLNRNKADNRSLSTYTNINRFEIPWRISEREVMTNGLNNGLNATLAYTGKDKKQTGIFKLTTGIFSGDNDNDRNFHQVYFDGQKIPTGADSTQEQVTRIHNRNYHLRLNYDKTVDSGRWMFSSGFNFFSNNSDNNLATQFLKKPGNYFVFNPALSNDFKFHQRIYVGRVAVKYRLHKTMNITTGVQTEQTTTWFNNEVLGNPFTSRYTSWLPFTTFTWRPNEKYNLNFSYKKSIQRPGTNELNPAVDYSDPYNTRFGNPYLKPAYSHNFDLILNRWHKTWFWNISTGYNRLTNLYSPLRELLPDGRTQITWKNISSRHEYEASAWGGYNFTKNARININAGYVYNVYSAADKSLLRYRDGGSFTSGINGSYNIRDRWQYTGIVTYNRFSNPQGAVRSNINLNIGVQRKMLQNRLVVSLNVIDPFTGQVTRSVLYGSNFLVESDSYTRTRNIKLGISYNFIKPPKVKKKVLPVKK
jgi:hypothetical protein